MHFFTLEVLVVLVVGSVATLLSALPTSSSSSIEHRFFTDNSSLNRTWSPLTAEGSGVDAIVALVQRRLPETLHNSFEFVLNQKPASNGSFDDFVISNGADGKIKVSGSSTSGLARGLMTYLRTAGVDIYWSSTNFDSLSLDHSVHIPESGISGSSWAQYRYAFNVVTYSYTLAFYDWEEWEYLLDWASLHGINLPLSIGGQEFIWREVYRDFGLSEPDIMAWFSGPAFESWQRMGNIHGSWDNNGASRPVSSEWLDKQWALQKKIVSRMVALGMTPILPAFNGFVPAALHDIVGGPEFINASNWEGFGTIFTNDTAVDPTWSTYATIQTAFLRKQSELYGNWTSHFYSIDLFNELTPSSLDLAYLTNNTASVVASLRAVDSTATWVMQGWLFVADRVSWNSDTIPALLAGAKGDEMLILDLTSEAIPVWNMTDSFGGKRWVWNLLHDYGENQGLYGSLEHYAQEVIRAKGNSSTMVGTGITMEGMNQNEIVYEFTLDSPWSLTPLNVTSWVHDFVERRYSLAKNTQAAGGIDAHDAWSLLSASAYNNTDASIQAVIKSPLELVPDIAGLVGRTGHHGTKLTYDPKVVVNALDKLISAADSIPSLMKVEAFQYDLVDVARQVFMNLGINLYEELVSVWNSTALNPASILAAGASLQSLLLDVDRILATSSDFLLSHWIRDARSWSANATEQAFLEYEARDQITIWGTASTIPWPLNRYASKQWAGLVREFYVPGWDMFTKYLTTTTPATYNQITFSTELLKFELDWQTTTWGMGDNETFTTKGESLDVIKDVREKWASKIASVYAS